jgi:hypothetical protein
MLLLVTVVSLLLSPPLSPPLPFSLLSGVVYYAEMNLQRRRARPLYLELRALGLQLIPCEDLEYQSGYHIEVLGLQSLSPAHADRVARRVEEYTPGL